MLPILFSIGSFHFYSLSLFLILAWLIFSFVFWRILRDEALPEEKIFDLTFYATLASLVGGRMLFIILNPDIFGVSFIKMLAIWVAPGISFWGALVSGVAALVFISRKKGIRVGYILDALAVALPVAFVPGAIGAILDGAEVGLPTKLPWAVRYVGYVDLRHPLGLYEVILFIVMALTMIFLRQRSKKRDWPYGLVGIWFFIILTICLFGLEFFKVSGLYLKGLSANQWIAIAVFAETIGAFYVRGGGRELVRPILRRVWSGLGSLVKGTYERLFQRSH